MDYAQDFEALYEVIKRYAMVCNEALTRHRDCFPFHQIMKAVENTARAPCVLVSIAGREMHGSIGLRFLDGALNVIASQDMMDLHSISAQNTARRTEKCLYWALCPDYLDDVLRNPQIYIENPARLNWDWLYPNLHHNPQSQ